MTSPDTAHEAAATAPDVPDVPDVPDAPAPVTPEDGARGVGAAGGVTAARGGEPVLSEQSPEDTDAAWGEYSARDDDRLYRDRPPHWDDV